MQYSSGLEDSFKRVVKSSHVLIVIFMDGDFRVRYDNMMAVEM